MERRGFYLSILYIRFSNPVANFHNHTPSGVDVIPERQLLHHFLLVLLFPLEFISL